MIYSIYYKYIIWNLLFFQFLLFKFRSFKYIARPRVWTAHARTYLDISHLVMSELKKNLIPGPWPQYSLLSNFVKLTCNSFKFKPVLSGHIGPSSQGRPLPFHGLPRSKQRLPSITRIANPDWNQVFKNPWSLKFSISGAELKGKFGR